jgi:hypothetical protein
VEELSGRLSRRMRVRPNPTLDSYLSLKQTHLSIRTSKKYGLYRRKHNPFISINNIRTNARRCANIVNSAQLDIDAAHSSLPNYMFYTPNMNNDGHNTNIPTASEWLKRFLEPKLVDPAYANTTFFITFDESDDKNQYNSIYSVLLGAGIKGQGLVDASYYDHYSWLSTIEHIFDLGTLGRNDVSANSFPVCH